jgi:hypothetical protein
MKNKNFSDPLFGKKNNSRLKNRRGVAEIISTMMLMAVTVIGASTLTYFVNDAFVSGNIGAMSTLDSSSNLLLLAYDTRDSSSLLNLINVDNDHDPDNPNLCGKSCSEFPTEDNIPVDGGSEFIVLQIQNNGLNVIFLENVGINNVIHSWDPLTSGQQLDANTSNPLSGKYPSDGMFSILPVEASPIKQKKSNQIQNGQAVNILVKLGADDFDINLNKGIHVSFNVGQPHLVEYLIDSGDAR